MVIIIPTELEAAPICKLLPYARIEICGVGMAQCAASVSSLIANTLESEIFVLAGIAGTYNSEEVSLLEVVEVVQEQIEGLPERFAELYMVDSQTDLRSVSSNTVNVAGEKNGAQSLIENMEGAAFMALCRAHNRRGVQIRAISNVVGEPFEKWKVDDALDTLSLKIKELVDDGAL